MEVEGKVLKSSFLDLEEWDLESTLNQEFKTCKPGHLGEINTLLDGEVREINSPLMELIMKTKCRLRGMERKVSTCTRESRMQKNCQC